MEWEGKLQAGRQVAVPAVEEELLGVLELPVAKVPVALEAQVALEVQVALEEQPALEEQVGMN